MHVNFHKWLEFEIINSYFKNGVSAIFDLVPLSSSSKKMKNFDVIGSKKDNLFSFYTGIHGQETVVIDKQLAGLDGLYFQLVIDDPLFFNYTDTPASSEQKIYHLKNGVNPNNRGLFQQVQAVSKLDIVAVKTKKINVGLPNCSVNLEIKSDTGQSIETATVDGTKVHNYIVDINAQEDGVYELWINAQLQETFFCSSEELQEQCIGILQLNLKSILADAANQVKYSLNFNARSVFWQYQVVVQKNRKIQVIDMSVVGVENENYEGPVQEQIIGGQTAQVFTTTKPLQLQDCLEQNPQLQVTYSNDFSNRQNQLELKLPNPEVEQLKKFNQGENEGSFFSTTIVYV